MAGWRRTLKILAQAPGYERTRFIQMAIVLLTTSGIGTLSMMFALHDGVHTSLAVAIIGGSSGASSS